MKWRKLTQRSCNSPCHGLTDRKRIASKANPFRTGGESGIHSHFVVNRGTKGAVAVAEENAYVVGCIVRDRQVQCAIPVKVAHRQLCEWPQFDRIMHGLLKRSISIAEQDTDSGAAGVGHGEV